LPDLFVSADVFTKPFFEAGLTADLKPLAAGTGFDLKEFDEKFLALAEYDGKVGFLPRAADVVVTYYNKRMFDAAKVDYPTDKWTYQDMLAAAEKLTIKPNNGPTTQYGVSADYTWWAYWVPMVVAEGGKILSDDQKKAVFDSTEGINGWNIIFEGLQKGWFAPPSVQDTMGGPNVPFQNGTAAMAFTVRALTPTFRDQLKDDWDVALVPAGSAARKTGMGTMGYAMSSQTKDPEATWKLLEYAYSDGMKFFMESYLVVPPIKSFYDDPAWLNLPGPPYNNKVFVSATDDAMLPPPLPFYSTGPFKKAMEDGIDAVMLGQMSPEQAVGKMAQEATRSLLAP
jgi:multiple sugar transport system substrate-binding protein